MLTLSKAAKNKKIEIIICILVSDYLEVVISFILFFTNVVNVFYDFIFYTSEIRNVFLEVGIDL